MIDFELGFLVGFMFCLGIVNIAYVFWVIPRFNKAFDELAARYNAQS